MLNRYFVYPLAYLGLVVVFLAVCVFGISEWRPLGWTLFLGAWEAVVAASGTTTFGVMLWSIFLPLLIWLIGVGDRYIKLRRVRFVSPFSRALEESVRPGAIAVVVVIAIAVPLFGVFMVRTVYQDHRAMLIERNELISQNGALKQALEIRRHTYVTTDPAFTNAIYLMEAFRMWRSQIGGFNNVLCRIRVTAPPETVPMASMVAQFSIATSNCATFGPDGADIGLNPDLEREAMEGMVPDAIVFHAARGDKAADQLFDNLSNHVRLKRSYEIPASSTANSVWLQFGTKAKWNSELREKAGQ